MKFKKMISGIAALAIAAGLGCTAFAEDQQLLNENFESDTNVFGVTSAITAVENGTHIYDSALDTNYNKVLLISDGEATATFDSDAVTEGNQPYAIASGEEIRVEFDTLQGWIGRGTDVVITLSNSKGDALVSYTYNWGSCNVTALSIGGTTPAGFAAFNYQSGYNTSKDANGWGGNGQPYRDNKDYNTHTTITINGDGFVETNFLKTSGKNTANKTYSATLPDTVIKDIASLNITYTGSNADNTDRSFAFDNLVITKSAQTATMAQYTVKYVCGDDTVRTDTPSGAVGAAPVIDMESFYSEDSATKYICTTNDLGNGTISEGLVVTVQVREAQECEVKVVPSTDENKVLASGTVLEGDAFNYNFPAYIVDDTGKVVAKHKTNLEAAVASRKYTGSVIPTSNQKITVKYEKYDGEAYFFEAEDVMPDKSNNSNERFSGGVGKSGFNGSGIKFFEVKEDGWYKVTASGANTNVNYDVSLKIYSNTSENTIDTLVLNDASVNKILTQTSKPVKLEKGDIIYVEADNTRVILDYVLIEKAAPTIAATLNEASYSPADGQIENVTDGGTATWSEVVGNNAVQTVVIRVTNPTDGAVPTVTAGENVCTPTKVDIANVDETNGTYFIYQFVGIDVEDATVFYPGADNFTLTAAE